MAAKFRGSPILVSLILFGLFATEHTAFSYSASQFAAVTTENEEKINRVRDQEIEQLKIVMGRRFSESRRPDILLRLAELYVERYRFYFF